MMETMKEIAGCISLAAFFIGVPGWCAWLVVNGVRSGVVRAKGFPYSRLDSPIYFWLTIAIYAAIAMGIGYFGLLIGLDVLRGR